MAEITAEDWAEADRIVGDQETYRIGIRKAVAQTLADQRLRLLGTARIEYAVRNLDTGWVYALPKLLPKFLDGKRGSQEAAEWHRRQIAGPDPEDHGWAEIVRRVVTAWEAQD